MQGKDFLLAMRRRWIVGLTVLLLVAGGTWFTWVAVGRTYQASAVALLVPPEASLVERPGAASSGGNPYLELGGLEQARDVVVRAMGSSTTYLQLCQATDDVRVTSMQRSLCSSHPKITYEVQQDFESDAPMISVKVEGDTAENALVAKQRLMDQIPVLLTQLQNDLQLPARSDISSVQVVTDPVAEPVRKNQIRASVLVGGGGLALGLLLTALLDAVLVARAARRARPDAGSAPVSGWSWLDSHLASTDSSEGGQSAPRDRLADPAEATEHPAEAGEPTGEADGPSQTSPPSQQHQPAWS